MADQNQTTARRPHISVEISQEMVEAVMAEWQRDNPLRTLDALDADEFAERMMKKITASAKVLPDA